jgi:ubiquinone/menaquinone biosynthesis C-methylase UbiE
MASLSFDGLTAQYDQTRTFDPFCFRQAMDWLTERFPPSQFPNVLEPGVGTGRIALPLVERGYQVTGLDISEEMLNLCAAQSRALEADSMLCCLRADAVRLPLRSMSFDLCVAVHLFYFISDWQAAVREMLRVLNPFGTLILLHTGFGAEVPHLNERYQEIAKELGYAFPDYGVRSTSEVVEYTASLGYAAERVDQPEWEWMTKINLQDALNHLRDRAYSFTKDVPDAVHWAVIDGLQHENLKEAASPAAEIEVPNHISIILIRQ